MKISNLYQAMKCSVLFCLYFVWYLRAILPLNRARLHLGLLGERNQLSHTLMSAPEPSVLSWAVLESVASPKQLPQNDRKGKVSVMASLSLQTNVMRQATRCGFHWLRYRAVLYASICVQVWACMWVFNKCHTFDLGPKCSLTNSHRKFVCLLCCILQGEQLKVLNVQFLVKS